MKVDRSNSSIAKNWKTKLVGRVYTKKFRFINDCKKGRMVQI